MVKKFYLKKLSKFSCTYYFTEFLNLIIKLVYIFNYKINFNIKKNKFFFVLNKSFKKKPTKFIIRNDRLGDSIVTLPFILGSKCNKFFYFKSKYIELILEELNIKENWLPLSKSSSSNTSIGANLSGSNLENISELKKFKENLIFTQVAIMNSPQKGYPILFSPNYASNISQTEYIKKAFNILKINFSAKKGIQLLNKSIDEISKSKNYNFDKSIIVFLGAGIDSGRQININILYKIRNYCINNNLSLFVQEEPNFKDFFNQLSKKNGINVISCRKLSDLFLNFRRAKLVIGFDCGPMHIASLCTQTLMCFSHTSPEQWGYCIWHKELKSYQLNSNDSDSHLIKYKNLGSQKNNWILYKRNIRCPIHSDKRFQKLLKSNNCCNLNLNNIEEILKLMNI